MISGRREAHDSVDPDGRAKAADRHCASSRSAQQPRRTRAGTQAEHRGLAIAAAWSTTRRHALELGPQHEQASLMDSVGDGCPAQQGSSSSRTAPRARTRACERRSPRRAAHRRASAPPLKSKRKSSPRQTPGRRAGSQSWSTIQRGVGPGRGSWQVSARGRADLGRYGGVPGQGADRSAPITSDRRFCRCRGFARSTSQHGECVRRIAVAPARRVA